MGSRLKNIGIVSISTIGSRVLGLVRDVMIFAALGAGAWASAFILAFTLPNLFRRLLGEGALTSALVPVFSDALEKDGEVGAFAFFNQVICRLCLILVAIVATGVFAMLTANQIGLLPAHWQKGAELSALLFPYMIFICLAAILSAALQVFNKFALAALTPVVLNLAMIVGLSLGLLSKSGDMETIVYYLCFGVLIGGFLQFGLPAFGLWKAGWKPKIEFSSSSRMSELWTLFLPGLLGAAILQLNILISRLLAYGLEESAVSVLYIGSRLMELPLGVFTIAIITVYFPLLSTAVAKGDLARFRSSFREGLGLILAITIPAGVGLVALGEPILNLLFNWGAFDSEDVSATLPILIIYATGLPFYSIATYATRGFHANKDMRSPIGVAAICLAVNALSGIVLMQFFGALGLAAGNVLAAVVQCILLLGALGDKQELHLSIVGSILKICVAALGMALICWFGVETLNLIDLGDKWNATLNVTLLIPLGAAIYFMSLILLRTEESKLLISLLQRRLSR